MKSLLEQVDEVLTDIYRLNTQIKAKDFVLPPGDKNLTGALLIHQLSEKPKKEDVIELGLLFHPSIYQNLSTATQESFESWTHSQYQSFSVLVEEVSHFRFFVFNAETSRKLSQLELEVQGEIDKFLLFYLFLSQSEKKETVNFATNFSRIFEQFSYESTLTAEAKERYQTANQIAREYIQKNRGLFLSSEHFSELLQLLRKFYRMGSEDRFSLIHRL